ncbi:major ampullate spidroin 2B variant 1 [Nephila pilipes]|uniref:Major ampullate spidroin 2B variant 1 n=1 Tax=Nephila pilipes TaxID=299642 RepID=A0A8X6QVL9_NEPPI|nr:major ampullate spidroin 2B variant 1 [Nephila pilipes]
MNWLNRLAFTILGVLCTQAILAVGQARSPWENTATADAFIQSFLGAVSVSQAFTPDQLDDMSTIGDTLMTAMDKMATSNKSSKSKLQALNMAFASSMAEIAVVEQGGRSMADKTNAIADALNSAFIQTTGTINRQFVEEIKSLISMFAKVSTNDVAYATVGGGNAATVGGGTTAAGISGIGGYGGQRGLGSPGPSGQLAQAPGGYGQGSGAAAAAGGLGGYGVGGQGSGQRPSGAGGQGAQGPGGYGAGSGSTIAITAGGLGGSGGQGGQRPSGAGGQGAQGYGTGSGATIAITAGGLGGYGGQRGQGGQGPSGQLAGAPGGYGQGSAAATAAGGLRGFGQGLQVPSGPSSQRPSGIGPQGSVGSVSALASTVGGLGVYGPVSQGPSGPNAQRPSGPGDFASYSISFGAPGNRPNAQGPSAPTSQGPSGPGFQGSGVAISAGAVPSGLAGYRPISQGTSGPSSQVPSGSGSFTSYSLSFGVPGSQILSGPGRQASAAASRLSAPEAGTRVSSAVSNLISSGPTNPVALSSTIGNAVSQISASNPGLSDCDVLVQALLEVLSALFHILNSSSIGEINYGSAGQSAQIVGQSVNQALC